MADNALTCRTSERRDELRKKNDKQQNDKQPTSKWTGIEDVEFESAKNCQFPIRVFFLCDPPDARVLPGLFEIYNEQTRTKCQTVTVDLGNQPGNPVCLKTEPPLCTNASYVLTLSPEKLDSIQQRIDPRFVQFRFTTTPETTDLDPQPQAECAAKVYDEPRPHYLARDYASFRQLLLDRLALIAPDWVERRIPDVGITLIELFAYVGDYLAYYQDAVATEAYLNTARQRISIRRHARLVDYELHEGCNARTFVQLEAMDDLENNEPVRLIPENAFFMTQHPDSRLKDRVVLTTDNLTNLPPNSYQPFEVVRFDTSATNLKREDVKNVIGLIAWLVLQKDLLSEVLMRSLPIELKQTLRKYTSTATEPPSKNLSEELTTRLNSLLQQYVSQPHFNAAQFVSIACWEKLFLIAENDIDSEAKTNVKSLKAWMDNFFTSHNSDQVTLYAEHNSIDFYTWDQSQCFLPIGSTRATLKDEKRRNNTDITADADLPTVLWCSPIPQVYDDSSPLDEVETEPTSEPAAAKSAQMPRCSAYVLAHLQQWRLKHLSRGDILIFEEVLGPKTNNKADADPSHRQAVRLTNVQFCIDPVNGKRLVEIEWAPEDALRFPLCISSVNPPNSGEDRCKPMLNVSVARGNVLMVDHGLTIDPLEWLGEIKPPRSIPTCDQTFCDEPLLPDPTRSDLFRPVLKESDLTFAAKVDGSLIATTLRSQKPHAALPAIQVFGFPVAFEPPDSFRDPRTPPELLVTFDDFNDPRRLLDRLNTYSEDDVRRIAAILPPQAATYLQDVYLNPTKWNSKRSMLKSASPACPGSSPASTEAASPASLTDRGNDQSDFDNFRSALQGALVWNSRPHLLDSDRSDQHFVVEMDNERRARLRFGDDDLGRRPPPFTSFYARYRQGNGVVGNVGADKITHLVTRGPQSGAINKVRNPLAAQGGAEFETPDHAQIFAPYQFKKQRRAITTDDYANLVRQNFGDKVQNARAQLNWMGTWYEVAVAIDPRPEIKNRKKLVRQVLADLEQNRRIGHRLRVDLPTYVPLQIDMTVCVKEGYLRAHVQRELLDRFGNRLSSDGKLGFFHPSQFSFGDSLYVSRLISESKKIRGVENIDVTRFERRGLGSHGELANGVMEFGALEIARLDNDPRHPEHGCFCLEMRGAR